MSPHSLCDDLQRAKHQDWWEILEDIETPPDNEPKTLLLSLPTELHFAISEHLRWWELYALRLTCRLMNFVLPPLEKNGFLLSSELNIEIYDRPNRKSFSIPAIKNANRPIRMENSSRYDITSISGTAAPLIGSFYMKNQGYYICFGCGSIKDDKEWYEWRYNKQNYSELCYPGRSCNKGMCWKAWQRCGKCDEILQEMIPQRCEQHKKKRRSWVCRQCGPEMRRVGVGNGPRDKQLRPKKLVWW